MPEDQLEAVAKDAPRHFLHDPIWRELRRSAPDAHFAQIDIADLGKFGGIGGVPPNQGRLWVFYDEGVGFAPPDAMAERERAGRAWRLIAQLAEANAVCVT